MRYRQNRHQRRRALRFGRRRRVGGPWTIVAILVALGLLAMTARVFGDDVRSAATTERVLKLDLAVTDDDVRALLVDTIAEHGIPAMAAAIVTADGIVARAEHGRRSATDDALPVGPDDLWHLGSCTKAMTATLLACLIGDGVGAGVGDRSLRWDMPLPSIVGEAANGLDEAHRAVTLLDLVRMRGGIPPQPFGPAWGLAWAEWRGGEFDATEQRRRFAGRILAATLSPPGAYAYSNQSYTIAGLAAEEAVGASWETLMRSRLAAPLGIESMGFGAPETVDNAGTQPRGHRGDGKPVPPDGPTDNPPAIGPANAVHMTLADLARFVQAHLRGARGGCDRLSLDADAFAILHTPPDPTAGGAPYAGGWIVREQAPYGRTLWHNGSNTMWYAEMWLAPDVGDGGVAILVVCNQGMPMGERAVGAARDALRQRITPE